MGTNRCPLGPFPTPSRGPRPWRPRWHNWLRPIRSINCASGWRPPGCSGGTWPVALKDAPALAPFAPRIYALNPHLIKTFRKNFGALPKTDRADAFLIAERLRFGRQLPSPFQLDARYAPLQRLTRFRCHLAQNLAREKSYFLSFLFLTFSTYGQIAPFGDPFGATSSAVLDEFTTEELAQQSLDELAAYLQAKGRGRFADPKALAATLQRAARDSYRLDKVLQEPLRLVLGTTLATIRTLQTQLKTLDKTIAQELAAIPQTLASVPGLGPVWTAGLIAELGDITRFDDEAAIAQYAGLTWEANESGNFQAEDTALSKRGNSYLRYYLVEAANSVRHALPGVRPLLCRQICRDPQARAPAGAGADRPQVGAADRCAAARGQALPAAL